MLCAFYHVAKQCDIGHGADTTRHRRDRTRNCRRALEIDVTAKKAVDQRRADVDDRCARHEIVARDQTRNAGRDHHDLGHAHVGLKT
jgi:hypothetical protein